MAFQKDNLTTDSFFNGQLKVKQENTGYRFSLDAIVLASHVQPQKGDRILDLGTGCGIVSLILAHQHKDIKIYGIEVQETLARIAILNVEENKMQDRVEIIHKDLKKLKNNDIFGPVNIIVSNPPYRKVDAGRINPDLQKAAAKHEISTDLEAVVTTARRMLLSGGRLVMVYAAERLTDILTRMRSTGIEPKYFRMIHPDIHSAAKLILVEGVKGGNAGMKNGAPLILYDEDGSYTDEILEMFHLKPTS
ncbi:MAG: tRNA1(Val) (adenine(37)-N6)-methyltransferase [Deltaproteobacteria bacterium]|nr:tRNA1(Val) (adenine(37)-N6)-methyltransferase [Deltaproteobacteria bacterium]MBW1846757.1 tRNA1(Val) (adenine(37)-N6)-methyltransferase [Deltaproteobacteria bacterium]